MAGGVPTDAALEPAHLPSSIADERKRDQWLGSSLHSRTVSVAKCETG